MYRRQTPVRFQTIKIEIEMTSNHQKNGKNEDQGYGKFWFILGAVAGIAAGYYLNSDKGRRMRRDAGDQLARYGSAISEKASGGARQVQSYALDIGEAIRNHLNSLSDSTSTLRHKLEHQLDSGKKVLKGKVRKIEKELDN